MYASCRQLVPKRKSERSALIDLRKLSPVPNPFGKRELKGGGRQKGSASGTFFKSGEEAFLLAYYYPYSELSLPFDVCQKEGKIHVRFRRKDATEALPMPLDYEEESPTWLS